MAFSLAKKQESPAIADLEKHLSRLDDDYQALYARYTELYRPLPHDALQYGSRLDHPWIPNSFVRVVRSALRVRSR